MHSLSNSELLGIWERGQNLTSVQRCLLLLSAACPETSINALTNINIGRRDSLLLNLREKTFGSEFICQETCLLCAEKLELDFNVADIQMSSRTEFESTENLKINVSEYEISFRLPNSSDLLVITDYENIGAAQQQLFERCILKICHNNKEITANQLPSGVAEAVIKCMEQRDPQADVQLSISCPACGHQWEVTFDIVSFFWNEITAWAYRMFREVHVIALAYGWKETDILNMNSYRRQYYLEMIEG